MAKYISLTGYCSTTRKPVGIQFKEYEGNYYAVGSFSATSAGSGETGATYRGKLLSGNGFKCKHCGNDHIIQCSCGAVLCVANRAPSVTCPKCGNTGNIRWVDNIDDLNSTSINADNQ